MAIKNHIVRTSCVAYHWAEDNGTIPLLYLDFSLLRRFHFLFPLTIFPLKIKIFQGLISLLDMVGGNSCFDLVRPAVVRQLVGGLVAAMVSPSKIKFVGFSCLRIVVGSDSNFHLLIVVGGDSYFDPVRPVVVKQLVRHLVAAMVSPSKI